MMRPALRTLAPVIALLVLLSPLGAAAQIPESFQNLQVLPKDIARDSLLQVMRGFSFALGVRCQHCHVGEEGPSLANIDFASDDKPAKRKARIMMRMVHDLNATTLASLPDRSAPPASVACVTCHRGLAVPRTLADHLRGIIAAHGADSAVAEYRRLRRDAMHLGTWDFGEWSMNELARVLAGEGRTAEAIAILEMNGEFYPRSSAIDVQLGELHLARGERDRAIARFRGAVEKAPNNQAAQRRLRQLTGGAPPD